MKAQLPPVPETKSFDSKISEGSKPKFAARAYALNSEARRKRKTLIGSLANNWDEAKSEVIPWGFCVSLNRMVENLELTQDVITFGRNKENTVSFTSPVISGSHCQIRKEQDSSGKIRIFLKDLSTNGTWHNRQKLGKGSEVRVKTGEEFWLILSENPLAKIGYVFYLKNEQQSARDSLQALEAPQGQVTFVFTDVQSSTNLWEMDTTAMDLALAMHDHIFRVLIAKFNGFEVKTEGDAFMITFYRSIDAVRWCLAVQSALNNHAWPTKLTSLYPACQERTSSGTLVFNGLRVRMGIHTGKPYCRVNPVTNRMDYFGPVVNCSARISDSAHGGQIVCSQEVVEAIKSEKEKEVDSTPSVETPTKSSLKNPKTSEHVGQKLSLDDFRKLKVNMEEGGLVAREEQNFTVKDDEVNISDISTKYLETMSLKGISEPVQIFELSFPPLAERSFPPLRTKGEGEKPKTGTKEEKSLSKPKYPIRSPSHEQLTDTRPPSPTASIATTEPDSEETLDVDGDTDDEQEPDYRVVRRETVAHLSRNATRNPQKSVVLGFSPLPSPSSTTPKNEGPLTSSPSSSPNKPHTSPSKPKAPARPPPVHPPARVEKQLNAQKRPQPPTRGPPQRPRAPERPAPRVPC